MMATTKSLSAFRIRIRFPKPTLLLQLLLLVLLLLPPLLLITTTTTTSIVTDFSLELVNDLRDEIPELSSREA